MQPPLLEPETRYCPVCRADRPHHHKVRYTRPASRLENGRRYTALVCEQCGKENVVNGRGV